MLIVTAVVVMFCTSSYASGKNSNESVYPSRQYDRLIKLRKEKLAEYLRVDENQLASTIHATMDIIKSESGAPLRKGIGGLVEQIGKRTITSQNGSWGWHDELISPRNIIKDSPEYKPDVEKIIDNYYKSVMLSEIIPEADKNNKENIRESKYTKIEIARGVFCGSIENDYQAMECIEQCPVYDNSIFGIDHLQSSY